MIRLHGNPIGHRVADAMVKTVAFASRSPADFDAKIACGEPMAVPRRITLDGLSGWLMDGVDGDPSSVMGHGLR